MLFSTTRFFSRAAIAFEEAAAKKPRKAPVFTPATLAKRQLKLDATPPVKKPLSGYLAFIKEKGRYPTNKEDFGPTAKENAAAWAKLSDAEKKTYAPTKAATEDYHQKITSWYNSLSPEVQAVAVGVKGFPKSFVKTPSQVAWAENQDRKPNAWVAFQAQYRAENDVKGLTIAEVSKMAAEAYASVKAKKEEVYEEDDGEEEPKK